MIQLFRKMRVNLLHEQKTARYFKYAIGEIILVVIGILIALQINTWKEDNQKEVEETIYLQNLRADLIRQIESLDQNIRFEQIIKDDVDDIIAHYEANQGFYHMDTIYAKLNDLSIRFTFTNQNTTLAEMLNSGQINLIRDEELKKELIGFHKGLELFGSKTQSNNTNHIDGLIAPLIIQNSNYASVGYTTQIQDLLSGFGIQVFSQFTDDKLKNESIRQLNEPKLMLALVNAVVFRKLLAHVQLVGYQKMKRDAIQTNAKIELELESR